MAERAKKGLTKSPELVAAVAASAPNHAPEPASREGTLSLAKSTDKNAEAPEPAQELFTQRKRPELGRYLLQVDHQTKRSFADSDAAQAAGLVIKTGHPILQVAIYDATECVTQAIELPEK